MKTTYDEILQDASTALSAETASTSKTALSKPKRSYSLIDASNPKLYETAVEKLKEINSQIDLAALNGWLLLVANDYIVENGLDSQANTLLKTISDNKSNEAKLKAAEATSQSLMEQLEQLKATLNG